MHIKWKIADRNFIEMWYEINSRIFVNKFFVTVAYCSGDCWENGTRAIKAASLAAASQCLRTFCSFLQDEADEILKSTTPGLMNAAQATAVYNEVIPVMQWLCSRLIEPR